MTIYSICILINFVQEKIVLRLSYCVMKSDTFVLKSHYFTCTLNSSHTVAYHPNARRAYEKSQHAEDFGHIKIFCSFNAL